MVSGSLHLRLNLASILVVALVLAGTGAVLDNAYAEGGKWSLQERMAGLLQQLLTVADVDRQGRLLMPSPTDLPSPKLALPNAGWYAFVSRGGQPGQVLWRSPSSLALALPPAFAVQVGQKHWRQLRWLDGKNYYCLGFGFQRTVKDGVFGFDFYLLTELAPLENDILAFRQRLWGGLAGVALLSLGLQIGLLRWGLRPLRQISAELHGIEGGMADHIGGQYPREIRLLTDRINSLLEQERSRQRRYRNALADLAHSLKTPLAVLLAANGQHDELPAVVREQAMRMLAIVERQLQRAGAAGSATLPKVAVAPLAARLAGSLDKVHQHKPVTVHHRLEPGLHLRCDESDLIEMLGNLLDNAFKWCRSAVMVDSLRQDGKIILRVHDDGPGIAAEQTAHILRRGGRADETTPGHGIGLSLVADIIDSYHGQLRIGRSPLGGVMAMLEFAEAQAGLG